FPANPRPSPGAAASSQNAKPEEKTPEAPREAKTAGGTSQRLVRLLASTAEQQLRQRAEETPAGNGVANANNAGACPSAHSSLTERHKILHRLLQEGERKESDAAPARRQEEEEEEEEKKSSKDHRLLRYLLDKEEKEAAPGDAEEKGEKGEGEEEEEEEEEEETAKGDGDGEGQGEGKEQRHGAFSAELEQLDQLLPALEKPTPIPGICGPERNEPGISGISGIPGISGV
ncbi:NCOA1 protein, partial [Hirundo rustica]|nr:NCOA1 protein [Hirundo rustica]